MLSNGKVRRVELRQAGSLRLRRRLRLRLWLWLRRIIALVEALRRGS